MLSRARLPFVPSGRFGTGCNASMSQHRVVADPTRAGAPLKALAIQEAAKVLIAEDIYTAHDLRHAAEDPERLKVSKLCGSGSQVRSPESHGTTCKCLPVYLASSRIE